MWIGDTMHIAEIARLTPSACNTQPWIVENTGIEFGVYRFMKIGKRGVMPAEKVKYYNKIDIEIFLFMLETAWNMRLQESSYMRMIVVTI